MGKGILKICLITIICNLKKSLKLSTTKAITSIKKQGLIEPCRPLSFRHFEPILSLASDRTGETCLLASLKLWPASPKTPSLGGRSEGSNRFSLILRLGYAVRRDGLTLLPFRSSWEKGTILKLSNNILFSPPRPR